jgi:hypothetical protein
MKYSSEMTILFTEIIGVERVIMPGGTSRFGRSAIILRIEKYRRLQTLR